MTSDQRQKKVHVAYHPDKCATGDLAHEILRAIQTVSPKWRKTVPKAIGESDLDATSVSSWIWTVVGDGWVEKRLKEFRMRADETHKDILAANLESLRRDSPPYAHIEEPRARLIYSSLQYSLFLQTHPTIDYGEDGLTFERLYRERDPSAAELGHNASEVISRFRCHTPDEVRAAMGELIQLLGLMKRLSLD